jgi:hypothetical protein
VLTGEVLAEPPSQPSDGEVTPAWLVVRPQEKVRQVSTLGGLAVTHLLMHVENCYLVESPLGVRRGTH